MASPSPQDQQNRRDKSRHRFERQFGLIRRWLPSLSGVITALQARRAALIRVPLAILFILGGILGFLPILGFWMVPLGFFLLAIDIPALQNPVSALFIRLRRWGQLKRRNWRR